MLKIQIVSFIDNSGSRILTLLGGAAQEFKQLGHRIGLVKQTPHGFDIDQPEKNSLQIYRGQASDVVAISWHYAHWNAHDANTVIEIDGESIFADTRKAMRLCPNPVIERDESIVKLA